MTYLLESSAHCDLGSEICSHNPGSVIQAMLPVTHTVLSTLFSSSTDVSRNVRILMTLQAVNLSYPRADSLKYPLVFRNSHSLECVEL
jgi:hypothetical protein